MGTGFGRTGTLSLKAALAELGLGPCYHMTEVFQHLEHIPLWSAAAHGKPTDWNALFAGYGSTVDWPSTRFWRELIHAYPDAKVIHTERDPEVWWKSYSQTIAPALQDSAIPPPLQPWTDMANLIVTEQTFGGRNDKDHVLSVYNAHNAEVRRVVPANRLLVYDVAQGWEPLCGFLGRPVPATPFPKTNSTAEFQARTAARRGKAN